ncbi:rhodanese-like domain-containing protein [Stutzerimonas azotifigens]|uniref:rhodanese-like domain-containing protein n=1 Tax=Stutzerimonas azotifigens TaxID=291995 RepID=UPI0005B888B5|nr:rhodanese-like domain-containing protein [Stutzerimonas azotifigens]
MPARLAPVTRALLATLALVPLLCHAGEIDRETAIRLLDDPRTLLVDVRTPQEQAQGMLAGAQPVETAQLGGRIGALAPDKDTPIVLYCRSGRRSSEAQELLRELGYRQVVNGGGYDDLRAALHGH